MPLLGRLQLMMANNMDVEGLKVKPCFQILKSEADKTQNIKLIVVMANGKLICYLNGVLLIGTSNSSSFFSEFGNDWVRQSMGQLFSTFRIS